MNKDIEILPCLDFPSCFVKKKPLHSVKKPSGRKTFYLLVKRNPLKRLASVGNIHCTRAPKYRTEEGKAIRN